MPEEHLSDHVDANNAVVAATLRFNLFLNMIGSFKASVIDIANTLLTSGPFPSIAEAKTDVDAHFKAAGGAEEIKNTYTHASTIIGHINNLDIKPVADMDDAEVDAFCDNLKPVLKATRDAVAEMVRV